MASLPAFRAQIGAHVNWKSENAIPANATMLCSVSLPRPKPKRSMLPVLVVLFLFAWGLMASLIMEQGRTIQAQRSLIQSLFQDSSQLSHMKGEAFQKRQAEAQAQAAAKAHSQAETPSTQDKLQAQQDPVKENQAKNKLRKQAPPRPPTEADTLMDERRTVMVI